jgi:hypothetical protein
MQIVIQDERYVGDKYRGLKKQSDGDINKLENKTNNLNMFHIAAQSALANGDDQEKVSLTDDMAKKYLEKFPIEGVKTEVYTVKEKENRENIEASPPVYTVKEKNEDIFEIEEGKEIEKTDGVIEGVNDGVKEPILDWSGETFITATNESEVKIDVIKPIETPKIEEKTIEIPIIEDKNKNIFISESNFDNPDDVPKKNKNVFDMLTKMAKSQKVKEDD